MQGAPIFQECRELSVPGGVVWRFDRAFLKPPHHHGQLEVLFVRSGRARLYLGTQSHELRAGLVVWLLPGLNHFASEFSDDFDMWVLHAEPERVYETLSDRANDPSIVPSPYAGWMRRVVNACGASPLVVPRDDDMGQIDKVCARAHDYALEPDSTPMVERVLQVALDASERARGNASPDLSTLAGALVAEDLEVSREQLCMDLDIGPAHLARQCKRGWGHGFAEQRSRARVASFLSSLRSARDQTLLRAGLSSGFGSYSQLHRTFRQVTGFRPRDYVLGGGRNERARLSLTL